MSENDDHLKLQLDQTRERSAFLDQAYDGLIILTNKMADEIAAKDARIAILEAAILPFARSALSTEPEAMKTRLFSFEDHDAKIQAARDALEPPCYEQDPSLPTQQAD